MANDADASLHLHVFFLPYLSPGHMLPMVDMARRFAEHGVKCTVVTTPVNVCRIQRSIDRANQRGRHSHRIELLEIKFPSSEAGLPEGWENLTCFPTPAMTEEFHTALGLLRQLFDQLLKEHRPDCIVSDVHFAWTAESSLEFGIPRLVFPGIGSFAAVVSGQMRRHRPHEKVSDDNEVFAVPGLPHRIELKRSQLPEYLLGNYELMDQLGVANGKSYGVLMNTFVELEEGYIQKEWPPKLWYVGPLSLCNRDVDDMAVRGDTASIGCLRWLDGKTRSSVLYVCFGSMGKFTSTQLQEIAVALEASSHPYIWVIKDHIDTPKWLPEAIEEGKNGLIITGWAPQILILNHEAVGGFMTHCGWNSCLEAISAGVPMVTWPLYAEQFFNERFIVDVVKVGVGVESGRHSNNKEERGLVKSLQIVRAVAAVMDGEEQAEGMRKRVEELSVMAARAVERDGSSYSNMTSLIEDLIGLKKKRTSHGKEISDLNSQIRIQ